VLLRIKFLNYGAGALVDHFDRFENHVGLGTFINTDECMILGLPPKWKLYIALCQSRAGLIIQNCGSLQAHIVALSATAPCSLCAILICS
jgi:hypothetical protein